MDNFIELLMRPQTADAAMIISSRDSIRQAAEYINLMRSGQILPLATRFPAINQLMGGGFHWQQVAILAGRSGSGKTSIVNMFKQDFLKSPQPKHILMHELEMKASDLDIRTLLSEFSLTHHQLTGHAPIPDEETILPLIREFREQMASDALEYMEDSLTVPEIERLIYHTALRHHVRFYIKADGGKLLKDDKPYTRHDKGLIYILDHSLLTDKNGSSEQQMLSDLIKMGIRVKKRLKICLIILSQLNRDILHASRMQLEAREGTPAKEMQFPQVGDIRGSDEMTFGADTIIIAHNPETLGIHSYGPRGWPTGNRIFMHFLKQRFGGLGIFAFRNELAYSRLQFDSNL